jgi:OmpA-OmpF porin, OOP family
MSTHGPRPARAALRAAGAALLSLTVTTVAGPAAADPALPPYLGNGFALDAFNPAPAGDRFLIVPDAAAAQDEATNELNARLLADRAIAPLTIQSSGGTSASQALNLDLGIAFAVGHTLALNADLPLVLKQRVWVDNSNPKIPPSSPVTPPSSGDAGDMRLGLRAPLPIVCGCSSLQIAGAADLWVKSGDQETLTGDGAVRFDVRLNVSGASSGEWAFEYAASMGVFLGPTQRFGDAETGFGMGSGIPVKAAVGLKLPGWNPRRGNAFRAAVEYVETFPFSTDALASLSFARKSPGEMMFTGSETLGTYDGHFTLRAGVGAGLTAAPGVPEARLVLGIEYTTVANKHHR